MDDVTLIANIQGFIFSSTSIAREIIWVHLKQRRCETISDFTPNYELNDLERGIIYICMRDVPG